MRKQLTENQAIMVDALLLMASEQFDEVRRVVQPLAELLLGEHNCNVRTGDGVNEVLELVEACFAAIQEGKTRDELLDDLGITVEGEP